jgi:hypothetical protein
MSVPSTREPQKIGELAEVRTLILRAHLIYLEDARGSSYHQVKPWSSSKGLCAGLTAIVRVPKGENK